MGKDSGGSDCARDATGLPALSTRRSADKLIEDLHTETKCFWHEASRTDWFDRDIRQQLQTGKEIGHSLSSLVDQRTFVRMQSTFPDLLFEELDDEGAQVKRSIGDFWGRTSGRDVPINVKTGITMTGKPNLVSLVRLLRAVAASSIDRYCLTMIKFDPNTAEPHVTTINLFDYLPYTHFNAGPGQLMLKEKQLYTALHAGILTPTPIEPGRLAQRLFDIYKDGVERLVKSRQEGLEALQELV